MDQKVVLGVYTNWKTQVDKDVIRFSGDGIDSEGIEAESFSFEGELTVESSAAVTFSSEAMSGTGLSFSETVNWTWDCSSFNCWFIFRVSSSIYENKDSNKPL